ncbi:hypothetical protein E4T56_gene11129 [Termitomyces sp. T112]|nr:hypothetical protein E4T56_gene11129 [Termitomyces sp. T112]
MASSILRNLNPAGGVFDQPAAHTLALSAHPRPNPSPVPSEPGNSPPSLNPAPNGHPHASMTTTGLSPTSTSLVTPPTSTPHTTDLHKTNSPTSTSAPLISMPLCSIPMPQSPCDSSWVLGCPDHPFLPTIFVPCLLQCLTLLPTPIILDSPPPEGPLNGPQGPPWATQVNSLAEGHPMADPLEDGARRWTTSPPSAETGTTTITTTTPDPCPKFKIHRTIPTMHWPGRVSSTFRSPNPSPAATPRTKLITFQLESSQVAFATSYLQGIVFDHYIALLKFDPNKPVLSNWLAFTQEFSTYETGWNYNALQLALRCALPQWIKDILHLAPKQTTYDRYKVLITQVDQHYWEDRSKNMAPRLPRTPLVTPTGRPEQPTVFDPQSPLTLLILRPIFPQAEELPAPIDSQDNVFPTLVDSGASGIFVSNQLGLWCNDLDKPLELQLFDRSPATTRITQYHNNTPTLDNDLQFQAQLLVTQLPLPTPIVLGLPWLQDVNPDIDWKNLTMQFPSPKASLAATIPLCLQSISDSDISHPGTSTFRATQSPSTSKNNPDKEGNATPPWSPSLTLQWLPSNIPRNQYKGPWYPDQQCHDPFPEALYTTRQTPALPEPPRRFVKLPQHSVPTLANSGTFSANSDGPLANSDVFLTAAGASPGLPEPLGPLSHCA